MLGRYELVHALGQGGMGEVFLAKISGAAGFEKPCIVKTILPSLLSDRQFLDRFHHEAKVLVHLAHSNIAQVYDMGEAEGSYFMSLEYVAGVDLSQLMEAVRNAGLSIPIPVALYIGARIAEGLGYAHRKAAPDGTPLGIVHRDISPHNVMVGYEGEVKVIDFGLARSAARSRYTLPATVMGKLGYMSPEQTRADPVDHRADIYAAGLVIWELLAGRAAIPQGTMGEMMAAMANPRVPLLRELRPEISPALEAAVAQALSPDPAGRYARADELARRLTEQLIALGDSLGGEEVGQYVRTVCPEAFAAQRSLISKLSTVATLKRTPIPLRDGAPPPVPTLAPRGTSGTLEQDDGFAATHVRSLSDVGQAPRGSRTPWLVAGVSVVLLAAMGGFLGWRALGGEGAPAEAPPSPPVVAQRKPPPHSPVAAPTPVATEPEAGGEPAPVEPAPPDEDSSGDPDQELEPDPDQEPEPDPDPTAGVAAPPKQHRSAPPVEWVSGAKVGPLISDRSGSFVRAGAADGLSEGAVLQITGAAEKSGRRRVLGSATVLEVKPHLSRVALDDSAKRARGARYAVLPAAPVQVVPRPPPATPATAVQPAAVPAPVPPPAAAVEQPEPKPEPAPAVAAPAPAPVPAPKPATRRLMGRVTVGGKLSRYLLLHNSDERDWTECFVFIRDDGKYPAKAFAGPPIPAGETREVALGKFHRDPNARLVAPNMVGVACEQGATDFPARY